MNEKKTLRSLGTHDGTFHADEVTACALLVMFDLIDKDKIYRTRDEAVLSKCEYICDVGGMYKPEAKLFDHHQLEYQGDLSSAGMVLLYLREAGYIQPKEYQFLNETLIIGVDAHDNGKEPPSPGFCSYSEVIANFAPIPYDPPEEEQNRAFHEALDFVTHYLRRLLDRYHFVQSCREIVEGSMKRNKECLMFDRAIPWQELFFELGGLNHPAQFVIMPSGSHWILRGVPPNLEDKMNVRHPLPRTWAGLLKDDLARVSGISGAIFCHKGRFISVWETRESALKALQFTLDQVKEKS